MILLDDDALEFHFPDVHPDARLQISFQRTLRIPDDGEVYPLPPGLARFPLRHVDDHAARVPETWLTRGGVMLPMFQSEALWLHFDPTYVESRGAYPFAIKVAAGKIDAVTGDTWRNELRDDPQDYMVAPEQPWLDGFCVEEGIIRQFVAMPLGDGYTAEEQLTRHGEHGGIQIAVYPMRREAFERNFPEQEPSCDDDADIAYGPLPCVMSDMGLAPGGRMRQTIEEDPYELDDWDTEARGRCFVHIANSIAWRAITGEAPPTIPLTAKQYADAGLPWFEYYSDGPALAGSSKLAGLASVTEMAAEKGTSPLPENEPATPQTIVEIRSGLKKNQVREGEF